MTTTDLIGYTFGYIQAGAPFAFVFLVIACAGELIGLLRYATNAYRRRKGEW